MNINNKKILVTGAEGFIGSHLVESLLKKGSKVTALVFYNSFNSFGWLNNLKHKNLKVVLGDMRDPYFLKKEVKSLDIIFNLAALISVPYSFNAPQINVSNNVLGTLNLLELAKDRSVEKFIQFSSSEVYGTAKKVPLLETDLINPQSPYAASKVATDALALSYFHSYNLPVIVLRPFNTFGPRQSTRAVIPSIICQIINKGNRIKLGSLKPTRDFCYIEDTIRAILASLKIKSNGEIFNISSNSEISIKKTISYFEEILKKKIYIERDLKRVRSESSEVYRLLGSNKKFIKQTNWVPKYRNSKGFKLALKKTFDWYLSNFSKIQNVDKLFT